MLKQAAFRGRRARPGRSARRVEASGTVRAAGSRGTSERRAGGVPMVIKSSDVARRSRPDGPQLSSPQVWDAVTHASFAVLSHVTPSGAPRSSGVVYTVSGRSMYVAVAPDSWKARQIGADGMVSVTVPVRRGGLLSL